MVKIYSLILAFFLALPANAQQLSSVVDSLPKQDKLATIQGDAELLKGEIISDIRDNATDQTIEVIDTAPINDGVQVSVKAFASGKQLGFEKNGTIEIEKVNFHNPSTLVPDLSGPIRSESKAKDGTIIYDYWRDDAVEALQWMLNDFVARTGKQSSNIIPGSIGHTTDVYYPDPNPESTSVDGAIAAENAVFSVAQLLTSGSSAEYHDTTDYADTYYSGSTYTIWRGYFAFDTSSLPDTDTIDSATFSLYVISKFDVDDDGNDYIGLYQSTQASNTTLGVDDYNNCGDNVTNPTEGATNQDMTGMATGAMVDWPLNTTGKGWVVNNGVTKLCIREGHDAVNDTPGNTSGQDQGIYYRLADFTGTVTDPTLTIVHSAGGGSSSTSSSSSSAYCSGSGCNLNSSGSLLITDSICTQTGAILGLSGSVINGYCSKWQTSIKIPAIKAIQTQFAYIAFAGVFLFIRITVFLIVIYILLRWLFRIITHYRRKK